MKQVLIDRAPPAPGQASHDGERRARLTSSKTRHSSDVVPSFLPEWLRPLLGVALLCELAAIGWFAIFGGGLQAKLQHAVGVNDLVVHGVAFGAAALTAFLLWSPQRYVGLALLLCAGLVELAQLFAPERQSSLLDFVAGAIGIAAAALIYRAAKPLLASGIRRRR